MFFGVRLAALSAAKPLKAVTMSPKLAAFDIASRAIHEGNIQQAVAVCQVDSYV